MDWAAWHAHAPCSAGERTRAATARRSQRLRSSHPGNICPVSYTRGPWPEIRFSFSPGAPHGLRVAQFGTVLHHPHAPSHNSLLPWPPEVLKTPIDAEWSQLSIARVRGAIGRIAVVVDLVTSPYRLRFLRNGSQSAEHGTLSAAPSAIPSQSFVLGLVAWRLWGWLGHPPH